MEEILVAISNTGFPIVIALYSLIRLEKTVAENTQIMAKMYSMIEKGLKND